MWDFLVRFFTRPREESRLANPGVEIAFNHRLRVALLYDADPDVPETFYD